MDNTNYSPKMTSAVANAGVPGFNPFTLVDVGCSFGINPVWRSFGDGLRVFGFDPNRAECERLQRFETNPNVRYFPMAVGLPETHDFHRKSRKEASQLSYYSSALRRSSACDPLYATPSSQPPNGRPEGEPAPKPPRIGLSDFFQQQEINDIDFIKVDTDGGDFETLLSAEPCLESHRILGFMVECMFQGSSSETGNTFHNIDRFMKQHGFMIYDMAVERYSRAVLPARFQYNFPAQTRGGQPLWGDVVFLRELAAPECYPVPCFSPAKILKLACLYEIFSVPDCAVELILRFREQISPLIDPSLLLDLLTPSVDGRSIPYSEYIEAVSANPKQMFPDG
jgi:FkbM family methyltransferase